ncbi:MAG TPA: hypothetical protein VFW92_01635 [Candidatus Limnocylindrales bacterium]|nr:hypothetical protein [Candidatus Limnocylindrales bacterium]
MQSPTVVLDEQTTILCLPTGTEELKELVMRRLLEAYGHVRLDEAARQLALDALGIGQPDEVRPEEEAWLRATLAVSGREVADAALEELAEVIATRLIEAEPATCRRLTRRATWCGPGSADRP